MAEDATKKDDKKPVQKMADVKSRQFIAHLSRKRRKRRQESEE